ncbi:MAG: cyclomaltodextrinase C-terminal domain-containing protein, partial [Prevotella sp.]|nr:cyclomaltodextrinase C-terminal domain-containing protein [Prevotella sp.]
SGAGGVFSSRTYLKTVMEFSFFYKLNQSKNEETDAWWQGLNRLYNSFVYDYLYPNPSSVMAFIENHDTDRFLGNGCDTLALKQALALLLTVNRIPQLYYGTEILMNGTKEVTDGNVRKDFPGGFPGDSRRLADGRLQGKNAFTREGRTRQQQQMFQWLSRLLHWRQGNAVISQGRQTQFIPYEGVYVIARRLEAAGTQRLEAAAVPQHSQPTGQPAQPTAQNGRQAQPSTVLTVLNGTSEAAVMQVQRYQEVIGSATRARDVLTGRYYDLSKDVQLKPRQSLVLEF